MLYQELVEFSKPYFSDFCKNITLFENAFCWDKFNEECYDKMYNKNSYENFKTVKRLKSEISDLTPMCKKCAAYYMPKRNKSIPKYDVIFGQQMENVLIDFFNKKLHIHATHADQCNKKYPDCMILGKDRGIIAYFEVKYHAAPFIMAINKIHRYCYESSATLDYKKIIKQLEIIDSDLDRPVFYLHWIDYPCLKGIFYETSEQVKDYIYNTKDIFERVRREGDNMKSPEAIYTEKVYSPLLYMGSFEEFIAKIKSM